MPSKLPPGLPPQRPRGHQPEVDWETYHDAVFDEYRALLAQDPPETEMQEFFERHPSALPGAFPDGTGHGALFQGLITQPELQGIDSRRPDFMWLTRNSVEIKPVLIEIESPAKPWIVGAPKDPRASKELNQAMNQLRQWEEWFDHDANKRTFLERYGLPADWRSRALRPQYWLIMGRRRENETEIAKLRQYHAKRGLTLATYDTVPIGQPEHKCRRYVTLRSTGVGTYKVKHAPPTTTWDAVSTKEWRAITGRQEAVQRSTAMDDERKLLLIDDMGAMDQWADDYDAYDAAKTWGR